MKVLPEFEKSIGLLERYDRYLDRGNLTQEEYDEKVRELAKKFNLNKSQYLLAVYKYVKEILKTNSNWEPPKPPSEAQEFLEKYYEQRKNQLEKEKVEDSGLNEKAFEKLAKKAEKTKKVRTKLTKDKTKKTRGKREKKSDVPASKKGSGKESV